MTVFLEEKERGREGGRREEDFASAGVRGIAFLAVEFYPETQ